MEPRIGQVVIVYDRYLFAVPVRGIIERVSSYDGALKIGFYLLNPGTPNVTKHNGKYFHREQCRGVNGELFYGFIKATPEELKISEDFTRARERESRKGNAIHILTSLLEQIKNSKEVRGVDWEISHDWEEIPGIIPERGPTGWHYGTFTAKWLSPKEEELKGK